MKKIETQNQIICENGKSFFNYFGWPSVAKLPDGTLAMVCSGFRHSHVDPFGKGVICYSRDEGKNWSKPIPIIDTLADDRDCGILVYNGKVFINTFNNGIRKQCHGWLSAHTPMSRAYYEMIDQWADQEDEKYFGSLYVTSDDGYTFSELKRSPVQTPHGPCLLSDGTLLFVGNPMSLGEYKNLDQLDCYSIDENENFTYLSTIVSPEGRQYCEPHAIEVDGKIILQIREDVSFSIFQCESTDGGRTWTEPHSLGIEKGSPPHLLRHSNGTLISVYGRRRVPYGQRVMFSRDNGETWDVDYILRDDAPSGDLGYPATVELDDGSLLTVYYQKENEESDPCVIMQSIWQLPEKYR